jgi:hypothetical protein
VRAPSHPPKDHCTSTHSRKTAPLQSYPHTSSSLFPPPPLQMAWIYHPAPVFKRTISRSTRRIPMLEESPVLGQEWGQSLTQSLPNSTNRSKALPARPRPASHIARRDGKGGWRSTRSWNVIIPEDSISQRSGGRVRASNFCCA